MKRRKIFSSILICAMVVSCMGGLSLADETQESEIPDQTVVEETEVSEETVLEESFESEETTATEETEISEVSQVTEESAATEETTVSEETIASEEIEEIDETEVENAYAISAVNFPDEGLRIYISENYDADGDGTLTQSEIDDVREFSVGESFGHDIYDLTGLQLFTGLESINIIGIEASNIELKDLAKLDSVYIESRYVTSVDLSGSRMYYLGLICENLTSLKLDGCDLLTTINCSYCTSLKSLDVRNLKRIEDVFCSDSGITSLKVAGTDLEYLDCSGCKLSSLDLSGLYNLRSLYITDTNIKTLDITEAPLIISAYISSDNTSISGGYIYRADQDDNTIKYDSDMVIVGGFWAPSGIQVSDVTGNSVKLSWGSVATAAGYEVWRSRSSDGGYVCIYQGSDTSKISSSLSSGTTYCYKVRAYRIVNSQKAYGPYSDVVTVTTIATPEITQVTVLPGNKVRFSWAPVSGVSGYEIRQAYSDGTGESIFTHTSSTSYTLDIDDCIGLGSSRLFTVYAFVYDSSGRVYGGASTPIRLVNNAAPANVRISNIGRTAMTITWDKPEDDNGIYTYCEVWRSKSPNSGFVCLGRYSNTMKVSTSLTPNTTYYYKVRAYSCVYDGNGVVHRYYTGYSNVVSGTTKK